MERVKLAKRQLFFSIAFLLLVAAWAAACGGKPISNVPPDEPGTAPAQTEDRGGMGENAPTGTAVPTAMPTREEATVTPTPASRGTEVELQNEAEQVIRLAREDLARRLGLALERIRLVSVQAVQWHDASLGCPKPGMVYAQVITAGFRVVLKARGQRYEYHTDTAESVILCGADGFYVDPVPLLPMFPHGKPSPKPRNSAH